MLEELQYHMAGGSNDAFINSPKLLAREIYYYLQGSNTKFIVNRKLPENN